MAPRQDLCLQPLGRTNHERRLREVRVGERRDRRAVAVLLAKFVDRTEFDRTLRAGFHADRLQAVIESVRTGVALRHLARRRIEDGHAVETGLGAETAAYAFLRVDHDETVGVALMVRLRGTDLHAGGIGAVVARDRDVVGLHVLVPGARVAILTPTARLHFNHFAEVFLSSKD